MKMLQDVVSDEGFQSLGDFLLREIRAKNTVRYPSLTELLSKLQVRPGHRVTTHLCAVHVYNLGVPLAP